MVLRPDAVQQRLLRLEEVVSELAGLRELGEAAVRGTLRDRWSVERGLQLGAEILFEIGQHILSARFSVAPGEVPHGKGAAHVVRRGLREASLGPDVGARRS